MLGHHFHSKIPTLHQLRKNVNPSTAILCLYSPILNPESLKPITNSRFFPPISVFPAFPVPKVPAAKQPSVPTPKTTNVMIFPAASGRSSGDEGVSVFEVESLVDGSSEIRPNVAVGGLESTLNRLSKWLVAALFCAVILWRHDAEVLWAAMGSVVNSGLSALLKQILNQERPVTARRSDPGMPSSHAQSIFFTIVFAITSIVEWLGLNGLSVIINGLILALGSYFTWLRVSQKLHTVSQVVVGAALGAIFSVLWIWSWKVVMLDAFIASFWVQVFVVLLAAGFCVGFLMYVICYWLTEER